MAPAQRRPGAVHLGLSAFVYKRQVSVPSLSAKTPLTVAPWRNDLEDYVGSMDAALFLPSSAMVSCLTLVEVSSSRQLSRQPTMFVEIYPLASLSASQLLSCIQATRQLTQRTRSVGKIQSLTWAICPKVSEYSTILIPLCLEGKNHCRPHDKQARTHTPDVAHTHENDALPRDSKPTFFALQFTFL